MKDVKRMAKRKDAETIEDQLRQAIAECGVTHYRIAKMAGCTPDVVSRFASGERCLRSDTMAKICKALGLELHKKE